jgi:short-subunit dehydrogenase
MSKYVIITGTSRGIGYELVKLFAKAGHKVLALSRNAQPINDLLLDNVTSFAFDLTKPEDFIWVEDFINTNWGKVDILINNA